MSSSIGIGFIYNESSNIEDKLNKFIDFFLLNDTKIQKIVYSTDKNGDDWHVKNVDNYSSHEIANILIQNYFGNLTIKGSIVSKRNINIDMSIHQINQKEFGFLLEIDIDQLFTVGNKEELGICTENIVHLCKDIYYKTQYQYAYCDHEVGIEYNWNEFQSLNEQVYSISIIPQRNDFFINLAPWEIDGLTNR